MEYEVLNVRAFGGESRINYWLSAEKFSCFRLGFLEFKNP
jgi:hypothetical protein